jgi:hypothetical protein
MESAILLVTILVSNRAEKFCHASAAAQVEVARAQLQAMLRQGSINVRPHLIAFRRVSA